MAMSTETVPGTGRPAAELDASIDELAVTTIRTLAMDAVQAANSGHPGTPMAMAPVAYTLWQQFLRFDPDDPIWPDRDRFVLSIGHASTLLYALLHLAGVKAVNPAYERLGELAVPLEDIKRFRQIDSRCPGHPEYRWTSGVETTTGPLGQGVATSVGMAIAGYWQAAHFNRPGYELFDYDVYAHLRRRRHDGGHHVGGRLAGRPPRAREPLLDLRQQPHHDRGQHEPRVLRRRRHALHRLRLERHARRRRQRPRDARPRVRDVQERVRPADADHRRQPHRLRRADQAGHGGGPRRAARRRGGPASPRRPTAGRRTRSSSSPTACASTSRPTSASAAGRCARRGWSTSSATRRSTPTSPTSSCACSAASCPTAGTPRSPSSRPTRRAWPSRESSGQVLNAIAKHHPWLLGGAADLAPSTKTNLTFEGAGSFEPDNRHGRNFHFGVREHAMGAAVNGLALSKLRAYGSGFLIFSDYGRAPIRLARADGDPDHPHLHPRLDRRGRGRPDPPADRAARVAARDARR